MSSCKESFAPPVLVLAGGFGTRLQGVLNGEPKPLAPIGDRPFLAFLLDDWIASGLTNFVFLLHHKAREIIDFVNSYFSCLHDVDVSFVCITESEPRGTGGAVSFAASQISLPTEILIVNADTWLPGGLRLLLNEGANCIAGVRVDNSARFGGLDVEHGFVVGFREKEPVALMGLVNGGAYRLKTELFTNRALPLHFNIETRVLTDLADKRELKMIEAHDGFIDIGIPEDYAKFKEWIAGGGNGTVRT